jgi:hypothetical protein
MRRSWALLLLAALCVVACAGRAGTPYPSVSAAPEGNDASAGDFPGLDAPPSGGDDDDDDATIQPSPIPSGYDDASDASESAAGDDALQGPPIGACPQPLAPGDLMIDELMIESVAGAGDYGEWLEVKSNVDCLADLRGLHGECPRGAKVATFDVASDVWLPPRGTFVVADSSDPAINHDLPGVVIAWFGQPGDVLRNKGTTITLSLSASLLDTVTYPALSLAVGNSVAFPSDCDPSLRSDFTNWLPSNASWFPGFLGTPNAPNADVVCPSAAGDW